jgi:hypothetical protein
MATALILAAIAGAQTRVDVRSLKGPAGAKGYALVVLPDGQVAVATLDGLEIVVDANGVTLHPIVASAIRDKAQSWKLTTEQTVFALSTPAASADGVWVYRNGLLMTEGEDYALSADRKTVTFLPAQGAFIGDLIAIRYRY